MTFLRENIAELPFSSTLFFPLSADPIGFNHFAAAEATLRANPELESVVFIPSNGFHPDPTKPDPRISAQERLEVMLTALEALFDPSYSHLARLAEAAGDSLYISSDRIHVWPHELSFSRAVRSRELVEHIRAGRPEDSAPLNWFAGSDLVVRMAEPEIFASDDMNYLVNACTFQLLERVPDSPTKAVQTLFQKRGVELSHEITPVGSLPGWLNPFLSLSSTLIRHAAHTGDPLGAMLPLPAAEKVVQSAWYREDPEIKASLNARVQFLQQELESEATVLAKLLMTRQEEGAPHRLAVAEASVGGWLTLPLAGRSGASKYFAQSRFVYDKTAKVSLLAERKVSGGSAVTEEMAVALAESIQSQAEVDYGLAETGMAGPPDGQRRSMKSGVCFIALATPDRTISDSVELNPFLTRKEHQVGFALAALKLVRAYLESLSKNHSESKG